MLLHRMIRESAQRFFSLSLWILALFCLATGCSKDTAKAPETTNSQPAASPRAASPVPNVPGAVSPTPANEWVTVEEFDFNWQADTPAHFKLEQKSDDRSRLTIRMKGQRDFVLESADIWVEYAGNYQPEEKFPNANRNLSSSKYALILPVSSESQAPRLVFLFGGQYASDTERLRVIALDPTGSAKVVFDHNFHITEFHDLDGDGISEIAGQPCFSQGWGHDFLTYDPYQVHQIVSPAGTPAKLSLPLTKEYNLKHYYGWAGPDCSEELAIVLQPPGGGKPVIVKSKEAEKMFEKKN